MSDVVSRLLAAIDERERVAKAATQQRWGLRYFDDDYSMSAVAVTVESAAEDPEPGDVVALTLYQQPRVVNIESGLWDENAAHIVANDPAATLRLCQAHRDIVAEWQKQKQMADQLFADPAAGDAWETAKAITAGLFAAVVLLARGYGVEDGEDQHG